MLCSLDIVSIYKNIYSPFYILLTRNFTDKDLYVLLVGETGADGERDEHCE